MLKMHQKQELIIRYHREGHSQRKISRDLGVHRKTVKRYLEEYEKAGKKVAGEPEEVLNDSIALLPKYNSANRKPRKLTEEIADKIDVYLQANEEKRKSGLRKQMLKKIDIWEELVRQNHDIGYTTVCNYVRGKAKSPETFIRQEYEPGEVCEFDWGVVKLKIGGVRRVYQLAVFTLAWSNYRYAILFARQDSQSFQQSHVQFFSHLNGVPLEMVYDNMRVAVKRFVGRTKKEATQGLLSMSMYYQFRFRFCNVGKGNEKGYVERSVEYIRRKAFAIRDSFENLAQANEHLEEVLTVLNNKEQTTKKETASKLLEQERTVFFNCPTAELDCSELQTYRVDKYATICVKSNHYSIPEQYVGKRVDVKLYANRLVVYLNRQLVASHQRRHTNSEWYLDLSHYLNSLQRKPGALKRSVALQQAEEALRNIYFQHFQEQPKSFIELLHYQRNHSLSSSQIQQAINELFRLGCRMITLDKIKIRLEHTPSEEEIIEEGEIELLSREQLKQLSQLLAGS